MDSWTCYLDVLSPLFGSTFPSVVNQVHGSLKPRDWVYALEIIVETWNMSTWWFPTKGNLLGGIHSRIPSQFLGLSAHVLCTFFLFNLITESSKRTDFGLLDTLTTSKNLDSKRLAYVGPYFFHSFGSKKSDFLDNNLFHWASTPEVLHDHRGCSVLWWPFGQHGTCVTPARRQKCLAYFFSEWITPHQFPNLNCSTFSFQFKITNKKNSGYVTGDAWVLKEHPNN